MCKFLNREDAKARQEERAGITGLIRMDLLPFMQPFSFISSWPYNYHLINFSAFNFTYKHRQLSTGAILHEDRKDT